MKQGRSFSAREPNCAFLNLGNGTFADISAISGIDFPDDGRGLARTDWDADGDLDLWIANRNAPRVRYLRNDTRTGNGYVRLRLQGTKSNRDAIGARVELKLEGADRPMIKTLRAGDGFLSQSSKWMHFGLGEREVASVTVRWPNSTGLAEAIRGVERNGTFAIIEGSGSAQRLPATAPPSALPPGALPDSPVSGRSRFLSLTKPRVPIIRFSGFDGNEKMLPRRTVTLLTLWASWCSPCIGELKGFSDRASELRVAGVDVVALSVDRVTEDGDEEAARRLSDSLSLPFEVGFADEATVHKLQMLHDLLFDIYVDLPLPASFLIDAEGRLGAFYRGPVEVDQLVKDVVILEQDREQRREAGQLFSGRWFGPARALNVFPIMLKLLNARYDEEALVYYEQHKRNFTGQPQFPDLLRLLGDAAYRTGKLRAARAHYEAVLERKPDDSRVLTSVAWFLATAPETGYRNGRRAVVLANRAVDAAESPDALDALAAAQAEIGEFEEAVTTLERAMQLSPGDSDMSSRLELYRAGNPYRAR